VTLPSIPRSEGVQSTPRRPDNGRVVSTVALTAILTSVHASDFGWNEAAGRYVSLSSRKFVSFLDVRNSLENVMAASGARMNRLTDQLIGEQISLAEWQLGMMEEIKISHTAAAASARGGWAQMSQADLGATGRLVRAQYDFLRNFANEIASGKQRLDGTARVRTDLYAQAVRGTFEESRRRYERLYDGMEEEARVLGEADHCSSDDDPTGEREGCLELAALGWQPIGVLPKIGESVCITHCHCKFIYRKRGPDGWIVKDE
jgi:hypothetical protein